MSTHHHEHHITSSESLRDFVIGMSDGLTVPFALAAGLSGAVANTDLIVTAGVAEVAAGAIAMGLGGYLGARTQAQHYDSEEARERYEIRELPHIEEQEVADILVEFGLQADEVGIVTNALKRNPEKWLEFMMRFELGLEKPDPKRLLVSPLIIGSAYVLGGMLPLFPYMLTKSVPEALNISIVVTLLALAAFGAFKGYFTGVAILKSALQTMFIGGLAAAAAFFIAKLVG